MFKFDNTYCKLPDSCYVKTRPTPVKQPSLLVFNDELYHELSPNDTKPSAPYLASVLSGNTILEGSEPIACAYAGHQFGHFVPSLGDGRAILLGEIVTREATHVDIQLKGAGPTAFSRRGDGRAALGPVLREYLVSEAMHRLGIPTTRSLAAVLTGEQVQREQSLTGAILTRVASSHIRVGTFEYFAARKDLVSLKEIADYTLKRHFPELLHRPTPIIAMLEQIVDKTATLVANWMGVGFIHGVMNTDNTSIYGETIDYGPCAFLDEYDPDAVFSSIDHQGRYRYVNQATIAKWNLTSLIYCLAALIEGFTDDIVDDLHERFDSKFAAKRLDIFGAKIGLHEPNSSHESIVEEFLEIMHKTEADFTLSFQYLMKFLKEMIVDDTRSIRPDYFHESFYPWLDKWKETIGNQKIGKAESLKLMTKKNPVVIPRNHMIEEVIQKAYANSDFSSFFAFQKALEQPFNRPFNPQEKYQKPPSAKQKVHQTFCGT